MQTEIKKDCLWCSENKVEKPNEHVFPRGLGGQDKFSDSTCEECNRKFGKLERELYQSSIVGLMRSAEGLEGYNKSKTRPAEFKARMVLIHNEESDIYLEAGQYGSLTPYVKAQIISIENQVYIEGDIVKEINKLLELFKDWMTNDPKLILGSEITKGKVQCFYALNEDFQVIKNSFELKATNEIRIDIIDKSNRFYGKITPRLYLDNRNERELRLRIRAYNKSEAFSFIRQLAKLSRTSSKIYSYPKYGSDETVMVNFDFDPEMAERALVKIGITALVNYFPNTKNSRALIPMINFVTKGESHITGEIGKNKIKLFNLPEKTHSIVFYQHNHHLSIRISLFNGNFEYSFFIAELKCFQNGDYKKLEIDYVNRINRILDKNDFLRSFDETK